MSLFKKEISLDVIWKEKKFIHREAALRKQILTSFTHQTITRHSSISRHRHAQCGRRPIERATSHKKWPFYRTMMRNQRWIGSLLYRVFHANRAFLNQFFSKNILKRDIRKICSCSTAAPILITPVQKKIDPLKWRQSTRKNEDGLIKTWKLGTGTVTLKWLFLHENDFQILIIWLIWFF